MTKAKGTTEVAERVGALVPASPGSSAITAKALRIATSSDGASLGLWPAPGKGVRYALFVSTHLVNLCLALGCGSPVEAVKTVALFRSLRPDQKTTETTTRVVKGGNRLVAAFDLQSTHTETVVHQQPVLPADDLGKALDLLVETLADPSTPETIREVLRNAQVLVTIEPQPMAEIILPFSGDDRPSWKTTYRSVQQQPDLLEANGPSKPISELQRVFYGAAFEALAAILNGTRAAFGPGLFQSGGHDKTPATKNAALPGAAPSKSNLPADPLRDTAPQDSSLDTCDLTACARVSSRGFEPEVGQPANWSRSHARSSDHHALVQA